MTYRCDKKYAAYFIISMFGIACFSTAGIVYSRDIIETAIDLLAIIVFIFHALICAKKVFAR